MSNSNLTRAEASRINGAKSRGPKSEAGKLRSSQNALRHGLLARCVVIRDEDRGVFDQVLAYHIEKFQPKDDVEQDLIDEMVSAGWRMRRLWWIETNLFNETMDAVYKSAPATPCPTATAFSNLADTKKLDLLDRYEARLHKMYQRAFKTLLEIRKSEQLTPQPNEPEPPAEEIPAPRNEPEPAPAAENSPLPNEPETMETPASADPRRPLRETELPTQPNEPETTTHPNDSLQPNEPGIPDDCYPSFTYDAQGYIVGETYIRVTKIPNGDLS